MKEQNSLDDLISGEKNKDKPIIFRANFQDKLVLNKLCETLNLKQSAVIRVAIRALEKQTRK